MHSASRYCLGVIALIALLVVSPAWGVEAGLLGVQIGATPKDLMRTYGAPAGIIVNGPGGLTLNTMRTGMEGLVSGMPNWARAVWPSGLASDQQMWIYRLKGDLSAGFLIKGQGTEAAVTDIIASSFKPNTKVETEKGIRLGDKFAQVLLNYGYPPIIQPYTAEVAQSAGPISAPTAMGGAGLPTFQIPGGGGPAGMMGGGGEQGMGSGGMYGTGAMRPAPYSGAAAPSSTGTQVAVVNHQPITFTRHCVILYNGLALTLYDFKVVRIHVSQ